MSECPRRTDQEREELRDDTREGVRHARDRCEHLAVPSAVSGKMDANLRCTRANSGSDDDVMVMVAACGAPGTEGGGRLSSLCGPPRVWGYWGKSRKEDPSLSPSSLSSRHRPRPPYRGARCSSTPPFALTGHRALRARSRTLCHRRCRRAGPAEAPCAVDGRRPSDWSDAGGPGSTGS